MRIAYSWLQEFISPLPSPAETARMLTQVGLEVEHVEHFEQVKGSLEGCVVGHVLTCIPHPDADRLKVTTVDVGKTELATIVCGASNVAAGQKVIVALPGTTLYPFQGEAMKIGHAKIRGISSEGMICAEDELGIGSSHDGILVLNTDHLPGTPASQALALRQDDVFEIGLTPNRGDAASHLGVAFDLAALLHQPIRLPKHDLPKASIKRPIRVSIADPSLCYRYSGILLEQVKIAESPAWLQQRLRSIGLSPINNVVDVTNYVLHGLGQPLHAFDFDKLSGDQISVNKAGSHLQFTTLDGVDRKLNAEDLMIFDSEKPICFAGLFGGKNSGIDENTRTVFLESACFHPTEVRKTSQRQGLKTDASFRFERGTDVENTIPALLLAVYWIQELAGASPASELFDVYPQPLSPKLIHLNFEKLHSFLGIQIEKDRAINILQALGFKVSQQGKIWEVSVPLRRTDVHGPADLAEEILRMVGFDQVPLSAGIGTPYLSSFEKPDPEALKNNLADKLAANGCHEIMTNSLLGTHLLEKFEPENQNEWVRIVNPLSEELNVLRPNLIYHSLEAAAYNINRRQKDLRLFEWGTVYRRKENKFEEEVQLSLLVTGKYPVESWQTVSKEIDFYHLAGLLQVLATTCGYKSFTFIPVEQKLLSVSQSIYAGDQWIGWVGLVRKSLLKAMDIKQEVWYAELNWKAIWNSIKRIDKIQEPDKFPEVRRDLSLVIDKSIQFRAIEKIAYDLDVSLIRNVHVFNIFEGAPLPEGKKSYSVSFTLSDKEKTLTDERTDQLMEKLIKRYESELGALIRR
jgi:phenylalanyl-tRNA synthetase beta chain